MFEYFYHEILRRTIIGFGTLFNNIQVQHTNKNNEVVSVIEVPLAYGPTQKFLARVEQQPNLSTPVQMTLPRMSFEVTGLTYDTARKLTTTQSFVAKSVTDSADIRRTYLPAPYNLAIDLNIMTKLDDDMLQIIEQILPYFQPSYTLTINYIDKIGEKRDIPIILENIIMEDTYEGDFTTRRALIYTLKFIAKIYLFGPVSAGADKDIIRRVSIGFVAGDTRSVTRDPAFFVTPVATKNYTGEPVTTLNKDVSATDTTIEVVDGTNIPVKSYFTINDETLFVLNKEGNNLVVTRGSYSTKVSNHVSGTNLNLITEEDNALIQLGDDFGFSEIGIE
jgi:hypothetical protein